MIRAFKSIFSLWLPVFVLLCACTAGAAQTAVRSAPLTADQVMARVAAMNKLRGERLAGYSSVRTYHLKVHGLLSREAEMVVRADYHAPATKEFTVVSESGSAAVRDRVFRRLMQEELDSMKPESQQHTALTEENYRFQLVDHCKTEDDEYYVLQAEPRTKDKLLFAGQIRVDAMDFAVTKIDGQPAVNPSWWTKSTNFNRLYEQVGEFWLPESNHSVTSVRFFGTAEMTITYRDYQITESPLAPASPDQTAEASGTSVRSTAVSSVATKAQKSWTTSPNLLTEQDEPPYQDEASAQY